jgi:glycine oxidase
LIIVGAGIIGLSCAWRLAERGIRVRIFDAREAASEASWAGAGMLAPGGEIDGPSPIVAPALRSLRLWPAFIQQLEEESGVSIDYRRSGGMEVALDDGEASLLAEKATRQAALGIRSEAATFEGRAARFYPDDAMVNPRDVTRALLIACRHRGVVLLEHEPVLAIDPTGTGVRTACGGYSDAGVLLTAGAWSSALLPEAPRSFPVRGHLISWSLTPGLLDPGMLDPILRNGHTYLLQRNSGMLVAGVSAELVGFERAIDDVAVETIRQNAVRLLPALGSLPPGDRWNGFRPGIDADGPAIGRIAGTAVLTAFGHYRNGILLAPYTAEQISGLI